MARLNDDSLDEMMAMLKPRPAAGTARPANVPPHQQPQQQQRRAPGPWEAAGGGPAAGSQPVKAHRMPIAWPPASGSHADANARHRQYMEDETLCLPDLAGGPVGALGEVAFYAVYDGHGGRTAVEYVRAQLHRNICAELRAARGADVPGALSRAVLRADAALRPAGAYTAGTTAAMVLLAQRPGPVPGAAAGTTIFAANVGDSITLLVPRDSALPVVRLSEEHGGKNAQESARIKAAGGTMAYGRVGGSLAVTRALGDHALKADPSGRGLTAEPYVSERLLDPSTDLCLLIGSDGLWESLTDEQIGQIARQALAEGGRGAAAAAQEAARRVVVAAMERGSRDNVSAVCVRLEPQ